VGICVGVSIIEAQDGIYSSEKKTDNPFVSSLYNSSCKVQHLKHKVAHELASVQKTWHPFHPLNKRGEGFPAETHLVERVRPNMWRVQLSHQHKRTLGQNLGALIVVHMRRPPRFSSEEAETAPICLSGDEELCWAPISDDTRWRSTPTWNVDTTNPLSLSSADIISKLENARQKWNTAAGCEVWRARDTSIQVDGADWLSPDFKNEISFENLDNANTLAVVVSWIDYDQNAFIEQDMVFNTHAGHYPFLCVALHEWGHKMGLSDIYSSLCSEKAAMYGYIDASNGEEGCFTELQPPDVQGVRAVNDQC